jgi:hypothetical protein
VQKKLKNTRFIVTLQLVLLMPFIATFLLTFALCVFIYRWSFFKQSHFPPTNFIGIFILKLLFGIAFYLVYTKYYTDNQTSDMHKYFNDAKKIYSLTKDEPLSYLSILSGIDLTGKTALITGQLDFWDLEESASVINDARMIIRFNLLMLPFSKGNIFIHLVSIVFLSFIGLYLIYCSFEKYFRNNEILLLTACFGIPSVMFWSSGIMKEGVLLFFTGLFVYQLFKQRHQVLLKFVWLIVCFFGIFFAKFYVALSLIPALIFIAVCGTFKQQSVLRNLFLALSITIGGALIFNEALNNLPLKKLSKKQNDFINLSIGGTYLKNIEAPYDTIFTLQNNAVEIDHQISNNTGTLKKGTIYHHWKNPGYADTLIAKEDQHRYQIIQILEPTRSAISLNRLMPTYWSVMKLLPTALVNVFFRPFINDADTVFALFACLENILIMLLLFILFFTFKRPDQHTLKMIIFSLLFVFVLFALVGITTPVIGASVRYKVPALPFLIMSIFLLYDKQAIRNFLLPLKKTKSHKQQ